MDWPEALETVIARTKHERYRDMCADGQPHAEVWRRRMLRMAGQPAPEPAREPAPQPSYPSMMTQAFSAVRAVGGIVSSVVHGETVGVSDEEQSRRLAICHECPRYIKSDDRCEVCGCVASWKTRLAHQHCPLPEPLW